MSRRHSEIPPGSPSAPTCKSGSTTEIFVCPRRLLRQGTSGSGAESDRAARDFPWMIRGASCRAPVGSPELCGEGNLSVSGLPGQPVAFNSVLSWRQSVEQWSPRTTHCLQLRAELEAIRQAVESPDDSLP